MAVFDVRSHPYPSLLASGALLPRHHRRSTARLPPIHRRPIGFASPPHDGFALLASAHGCPWLQPHSPNACYECTIQRILAPRNTSWWIFSIEDRCTREAKLHALSHARLLSRGR